MNKYMNLSGIVITLVMLSMFLSGTSVARDLLGCSENCKKTITWTGCEISKLGFMMELADQYGKANAITFDLSGGGATKGIREVVKGSVHLGGSCRLPISSRNAKSKQDKEQLALEKDSLLIPMGWDALVVIVHKDNPVVNISLTELKKILKGEIKEWQMLESSNGLSGKINLYVRKGKLSGVGRTLRQALFNNPYEDFVTDTSRKQASGLIETTVGDDVNGIAVTGYSSARKRDGIKTLNIDGVENNMKNLAAGKYPIYRMLLLTVMKKSLQDPDINKFILYAKSRAATDVIKRAGTLPFSHGLSLSSKLNDNYLMDMIDLEDRGRYNPSSYDLKKWANY